MRRRVGLFLFCGLVLPLVLTANASAQGAVLELTPKSGPPGTVITVAGSSYNGSTATTITGGVNIRLDTRDAEVLANGLPGTNGRFTTSFPIPAGTTPGEHLVIGTQTTVRDRHTFGTPGRAKLTVTAAASSASAPPGRGTSQATIAVGSLMVALVLLAGGALAVRRQRAHTQRLAAGNVDSL